VSDVTSSNGYVSAAQVANEPTHAKVNVTDTLPPAKKMKPIESVKVSQSTREQAVNTTFETISPEKLAAVIKELEAKLQTTASKALHFEKDEILNRQIVSVIDRESGEIIRQLPPEELLRAARNIDYMRRILFDDIS